MDEGEAPAVGGPADCLDCVVKTMRAEETADVEIDGAKAFSVTLKAFDKIPNAHDFTGETAATDKTDAQHASTRCLLRALGRSLLCVLARRSVCAALGVCACTCAALAGRVAEHPHHRPARLIILIIGQPAWCA